MNFVGLYEIGKKLMNGVYELISPNGNTIQATGAHLKPFNKCSPSPSSLASTQHSHNVSFLWMNA